MRLLLRLLVRDQTRPYVFCCQSDFSLHPPPDLIFLLVLVCNHLLLQPAVTPGTSEKHRAQCKRNTWLVTSSCCSL